ncbi:sugar transferase [Vibrio sp. Isolate30]|uniref:sugar transferase n=1 Tax=Vibrio sp. Isolate30 TaxID=2908536 RepID=UPI001EFC67FD|nr:sugar transferase [Vibrio sp. Isolate30]
MTRFFDFLFSFIGIVILFPIFVLIFTFGFFDTGSPIFVQARVGKNKKNFVLYKFRTMKIGTKSVASHLTSPSEITRFGAFLRKTKLDELPQLYNVLVGNMSLVGPRPNLSNQLELIDARSRLDVYDVLPGITGLAQIHNIDMSTPDLLAETDKKMIDTLTLRHYFKYIIMTATGSGSGDAVK